MEEGRGVRILVTGSAAGLGHAAADTLLAAKHDVVLQVRSRERLGAVRGLLDRGARVVVGDLADLEQTRDVATQANSLGRMDAVISGLPPATIPKRSPPAGTGTTSSDGNRIRPFLTRISRASFSLPLPGSRGSSFARHVGSEVSGSGRVGHNF